MSAIAAPRTLVLGLGNDLLGDDAAGLRVAREVMERLRAGPAMVEAIDVVVRQSVEMGLTLLDEIVGFDGVIVTDAIETGTAEPGTIHEFDAEALAGRHVSAPHFVGIPETLELGRKLGLPMPARVRVVAVEVRGPLEVTTELTASVRNAVPIAADRILQLIKSEAVVRCAPDRRSSERSAGCVGWPARLAVQPGCNASGTATSCAL